MSRFPLLVPEGGLKGMTPTERLDCVASFAVEALSLSPPSAKALIVVFDPDDPPAQLTLYSNASATDLVPMLRAALARIEAGTLRMSVDADTARWDDVEDGDADHG